MRIILKQNKSGAPEPFTSLKKLYAEYPDFKKYKENINKHLTRLKIPFVTAEFTLYRLNVK